MKPKPISSMQVATSSGESSISTPSASSTSADPERLVAERFPCFATGQPAPAAINAAVVEMLKVVGPPPVPAVSTRPGLSISTWAASCRIVRARPTNSETVSPFARNETRKAAVCTSLARPLHDLREGRRCVGGQVRAGADLVDRTGEDVVRHLAGLASGAEEVSQQPLSPAG